MEDLDRHLSNLLLLTIVLCLCRAAPVAATENEPGVWAVFSTKGAFRSSGTDTRWLYHLDAQARYFDLGTGINQWLIRPAVGYKFGGRVNGWLGYARFRTSTATGVTVDEDRYWQQVDWSAGTAAEGKTTLRVMFEQRSVSIGDDLGLTLRLMAKYERGFGNGGQYFMFGIEPFYDLVDTDWGGPSRLSQNRIFGGIGFPLGARLTGEIAYMNQYFAFERLENVSNHLGVVHLKAKF